MKLMILTAIALVSYFCIVIAQGLDPDYGWHWRIGEKMAQTGQIQTQNDLTYTASGYDWVDHEWAMNLWFYLMADHQWIVILLFASMAAYPFIKVLENAKTRTARMLIILAAVSISPFIYIRPAVVSLFLFSWLWGHLNAKFDWRILDKTRFYWVLVGFFYIWANLHAGFVQGLFLLGLFILWDHLYDICKLRHFDGQTFIYDCLLMTGCCLVTLINPFGWELWGEVLRIATSIETKKYINEWLPVIFSNCFKLLYFYIPLIWLWRKYRRVLDYRTQFIAAVFFLMAFFAVRNYMQLVIVSLPILALGGTILTNQKKVRMVLIPIFIGLMILEGYFLSVNRIVNNYPVQAVKLLNEYSKYYKVVLFADYGWGGYIEAKTNIKPFIDGRMPHWLINGRSLTEDYIQIYYRDNKTVTDKVFDEFKINAVLAQPDTKMKDYLLARGWIILQENPVSILLTKDNKN